MLTFAIVWIIGFVIYCGLAAYFNARFASNEQVAMVGFAALGVGIMTIAAGMHLLIDGNFHELRYGEYGTAGSIVALQLVITTLFGFMAAAMTLICGFIAMSEGMRRLANHIAKREGSSND